MHWVSDLSVFPCTTMCWYWYWYCVLNPYGVSEYGLNCLRRWHAFAIIGPGIGLSRGRCPDITLTNVNLLSITPLRTNFDEICIKNMQLKMQSLTRRPFWSDQKYQWLWPNGYFTMTSSNRNIFRVTDPLCGEFTGPVWINGWVNNREAGDLRRHRGHYDVNVMWHYDTLLSRYSLHDDAMTWKRFLYYWSLMLGMHRSLSFIIFTFMRDGQYGLH